MTTPGAADTSRLRLTVLLIVVGCLFAALVSRLWFLQVVNASAADQQVASAQYVTVYTPAPRGEILDRNGQVLVANHEVPVIEVERQDATDKTLVTRLAALLGMSVKDMTAAINNVQYSSFAPVPVFPNASAAQILYVQEHQSVFPGVTATTETEPYVTPAGESAADIIGYVGQADSTELTGLQKAYPRAHYAAGDIVGQTGVEGEFQAELAGTPGQEQIEVNAQGQELGVLRTVPPVPGDNLRLTIESNIQEVANRSILQGQAAARATRSDTTPGNYTSPRGSVVVEDPQNGQILAMASEPTYNPNWFNQGITEAQYQALADNADGPLDNWAIQGQYAPGSTFKLVTATVGLRTGLISPTSIYDDTGQINVNGYIFHDDAGVGAGPIDLATALTVSSDNYFNQIGIDLWDGRDTFGQTALQKAADAYGFGSPTGIDLPGESSGLIPTPATLAASKQGAWYTGDSAETAIGQFQVEVTPLQLANAYSSFANGGTLYRPEVALDIETPKGKVVERFAPHVKGHTPSLTPSDRQAMIEGYLGVVNDRGGTAYDDFAGTTLANAGIAGKTGTAQVTCSGCQDTSVFQGFAPAADPQYEVDCFMQNSGYGASVAAPVVREVYDAIFNKPLQPVTYAAATGNAT